jgi:hypothetical protein
MKFDYTFRRWLLGFYLEPCDLHGSHLAIYFGPFALTFGATDERER